MAKKFKNDLNVRMFFALRVSEDSQKPFLFMSAPGMGKTTSVEWYAKARGYEYNVLRGNSTSETEVLGYDVVDTTPGAVDTIHTRPDWFSTLLQNDKEGKKTLLFIDELTTCSEQIQGALLHLVFERKVGREELPKNTLIVAAGNYAQSLSSQFNLLPPLMNRFVIYNVVPTVDDINMFLSRYSGAMTGDMEDFEKSKYALIESMNESFEANMSDEERHKIGEQFESCIRRTADMLQKANKIDYKVTDLQGIYSSTEDQADEFLRGFITPRSLTYLTEMAISTYRCFGKDGVYSENFLNICEGLVGIGMTRLKDKRSVQNRVAAEFFEHLKFAANDIDQSRNSKLPECEKQINDLIKKFVPGQGNEFEIMNLLNNKIEEMDNDRELKTIERLVNMTQLQAIFKKLEEVSNTLTNIKNVKDVPQADGSVKEEDISKEELSKYVTEWNQVYKLFWTMKNVILSEPRQYKDDAKALLTELVGQIKKAPYRLEILRQMQVRKNAGLASIIPEVKHNMDKQSK